MIIDSHVKLGLRFTGKAHSAEEYIEHMDKNGISRAVICPNKPPSYMVEEGNDHIQSLLDKYPDKFYGAVRIDPWKRDSVESELDNRFSHPGFKAIYLHPWEENFQCNRGVALPIADYAQRYKKPLIIEAGYTWASHISQIADLARQYPDVKILVTNAGQLDLSGLTLSNVRYSMLKYTNLYMGTACAVAAEWLAALVQKDAKGRILFETGFPFFEPYLEKYRIDVAYLEDSEKQEVFSGNIKGFLGI